MRNIAVLMTCHNRKNQTLKCLEYLFRQTVLQHVNIAVYLVDDGSSDETGRIVKDRYPGINVIYADGSLFWNRGMHLAFGEALKATYDYYLWLNDDVYLDGNALEKMLELHHDLGKRGDVASIVVASTRDSRTGELTYGGYRRKSGFCNQLRLFMFAPDVSASKCVTMCGNCVLIPAEVADVLGNIDPRYQHRWGDVDYGLRAEAENCEVWVAPGYLAGCDDNPDADKWLDRNLWLYPGFAKGVSA